MKTIAFFVRNVDANKYPFCMRDLYYHSYQEYLLAMKRAGAKTYFVTGNESYLGKGRFSRAWTIDAVSEVKNFQETGEIQADLVFDKGGFEARDVVVVTDQRLHHILNDKSVTYKLFGEYQPITYICNNPNELKVAIVKLKGNMVVIKNPVSNGGKQVYIGKKNQVVVPSHETYPLIAQEFIDMSDGVPGLAAGIHDVRVLLTGSKIIGATLRQAASGSFYANVSKGGTEQLLSFDQIPEVVRTIAQQIDSQLDDLPRYYAIDFAMGKQGWKLIELNRKPGLFRENTGPLAPDFMKSLAEYLVGLTLSEYKTN